MGLAGGGYRREGVLFKTRRGIRNVVTVILAVVTAIGTSFALAGGAAYAAGSSDTPYSLGSDGLTKELYDYNTAIREFVWVEDSRGLMQRVDIIRPSELDTRAQAGEESAKIPSIMVPSPYYDTATSMGQKLYDDPSDKEHSAVNFFPYPFDNYFVPRGYAVVEPDASCTNLSQGVNAEGVTDYGSCKGDDWWTWEASPQSIADVGKWLAGDDSIKAYTSKDKTTEATPYWSNGKYSATGTSWDGGLSNDIAAMGTPGLKTIIPMEAPVDEYGHYYYNTGVGRWGRGPADKTTFGDLPVSNPGFKESGVSVFLIQGTHDFNVPIAGPDEYWAQLQEYGIPSKLLLMQYGHDSPWRSLGVDYFKMLGKWLDYWLYDIDNGVMDDKPVTIQTGVGGQIEDFDSWPVPGTESVKLSMELDSQLAHNPGELSTESLDTDTSREVYVKANETFWNWQWYVVQGLSQWHDDRAIFVSEPLDHDAHVSGAPTLKLRMQTPVKDATISYALVDMGPGERVTWDKDDLHGLKQSSDPNEKECIGQGSAIDTACTTKWHEIIDSSEAFPFVAGFADTRHNWSNVEGERTGTIFHGVDTPVNEWYDLEFSSMATDFTVPAGNRLAIVIYNSPYDFNNDNPSRTGYTIDFTESSVTVPIVGGSPWEADKSALQSAVDAADGLAEADYTADSYAPFAQALADAKGVLADDDASQDDVDAALKTLTDARDALVAAAPTPSLSPDTLVVKRGNRYYFKNSLSGGGADKVIAFGRPSDTPLVGDWDGDGVDTLAVKRGNHYYIKNSLTGGVADTVVVFGRPSDTPLVGDWDGDGKDTLAVKRGKAYHVKNSLTGGGADTVIAFGEPSDLPLAGDWDGDGKDTLAVRRGNRYYLKDSLSGGGADTVVAYGESSDLPLAGDWDGDGKDTLAVRRGNRYYLKDSLSGGAADAVFAYGESGDSAALSGYWNL